MDEWPLVTPGYWHRSDANQNELVKASGVPGI
jgi:hypothetical protein